MIARSQSSVQKLSQLLAGMADVRAADDRDISGLSLDSRTVGEGDLFLACAGSRDHGVAYIEQVLAAGVAAVAWEPDERYQDLASMPGTGQASVPVLPVHSLGQQVGVIADRFYGEPSASQFVIGITGTDGKTSCCHFIAQTLNVMGETCGVIGTLGYGLMGDLQEASHTTPDALRVHALLKEMLEKQAHYVVMEVSSHALDQGRVNGVHFNAAVLTNITRDHLDYHGDMESYVSAKKRLFDMPGLSHAVVNLDDETGKRLIGQFPDNVVVTGYSLDADAAEGRVVASDIELNRNGFSMNVHSPWGTAQVRSRLLGRFNAGNLLAVISVLAQAGLEFEQVCAALQKLSTVPGRMERFAKPGYPMFVVDYAHTPGALRHVLTALKEHLGDEGRLFCVFGCGGDRDRGKRPVMGEIASVLADTVILTNDNPRSESPVSILGDIESGLVPQASYEIVPDRGQAIARAWELATAEDIILVAGKGHESVQILADGVLPFSDREQVESLLGGVS